MAQELRKLEIGDFVEFVRRSDTSVRGEEPFVLSDTGRWYCAIVKAGCHRRAELDLSRLGYRSFYPKTKRWVSHARTKTAKESPILNRYVFVEVDHPRQSFGAVSGLFDIDSILSGWRSDGQFGPIPFPSQWVEGLICRYLAGEWDFVSAGEFPEKVVNGKMKYRENPPPPVGARIRVLEGEFADMLATVISVKGRSVEFRLTEKTVTGKSEGKAAGAFVRAA